MNHNFSPKKTIKVELQICNWLHVRDSLSKTLKKNKNLSLTSHLPVGGQAPQPTSIHLLLLNRFEHTKANSNSAADTIITIAIFHPSPYFIAFFFQKIAWLRVDVLVVCVKLFLKCSSGCAFGAILLKSVKGLLKLKTILGLKLKFLAFRKIILLFIELLKNYSFTIIFQIFKTQKGFSIKILCCKNSTTKSLQLILAKNLYS